MLSLNISGDHNAEFEKYFESESGHFPFERIYRCSESEQFISWITQPCSFFGPHVSKYLLKSLHMHDCPYADVTAAIINLYTACVGGIPTIDKMREFYDTLKKPLVNVCDGIKYKYHNRDICKAIICKDLIFLKVIVRYGVLRPDNYDNNDSDYYVPILMRYIMCIGLPQERLTVLKEADERMCTFSDELTSLYRDAQFNPELRIKLLRKWTVMKVLLMLSSTSLSQDTVAECMKFYFDATAENFVTVKEIEELTDIPQRSLLCDEHVIEEGYNLLRRVFPDSDILQPRTLQDLSRFAARAHLTERGVLPEVVAKLGIPDPIKKYILISEAGS